MKSLCLFKRADIGLPNHVNQTFLNKEDEQYMKSSKTRCQTIFIHPLSGCQMARHPKTRTKMKWWRSWNGPSRLCDPILKLTRVAE